MWPNGHGIWLEIRGPGVQVPVGVGLQQHLWQPLTPGCHKMYKKMIFSHVYMEINVVEIVHVAVV